MSTDDSDMAPTRIPYRSITTFHQAISNGETTVRKTVEGYLSTISELNPKINAITVINKSALDSAQHLDAVPPSARGPLHGVPFVIKDQIETANLPTAFGSKACNSYIPSRDATIVRKLQDSGAIILAKSTLPDWAASWFSTSSLSGTTTHPLSPLRDPGGSSSGSAAAVASGMCLAAIGGDTVGSIRLPASFCGLVGVRVTPGRISRDGMSSLVVTQDTPGPMTRCVEDAARVLDCIVGYDERDAWTSINAYLGRGEEATKTKGNFLSAVVNANTSIKGKRLGILRRAFGSHAGITALLASTLNNLHEAGATLIDVDIPDLDHYLSSTSPYVTRSKHDINAFLSSRPELAHLKIEDLQREGSYHRSLDLIDMLVKGPKDPVMSPHFGRQLEEQAKFQREVAGLFARHDLDAIVYPTCPVLAPKTQDILGMKWTGLNFPTNTVIASQLLFPAMSVPIGMARDSGIEGGGEDGEDSEGSKEKEEESLPVGLEILGLPLGEKGMMGVGAGVEGVVCGGSVREGRGGLRQL